MIFFLFILYFILVFIKLVIHTMGYHSTEIWYYLLDPLLTLVLISYFIKISTIVVQRKLIIIALLCSCFGDLSKTTLITLGDYTCDKEGKCPYMVGNHISNIDGVLFNSILVAGLLMFIFYIAALIRTQPLSRSSYVYLFFGIIMYLISIIFPFAYGIASAKMSLEPLPYLLAQFFIVQEISKLKIRK